jgi:uncharacterized coiled-coil DUF342 family protein
MYQFEVVTQKYHQKEIEIDSLMMRLGDMANQNSALIEDVRLYDEKLISKTKYIDELKERNRGYKEEVSDLEKQVSD